MSSDPGGDSEREEFLHLLDAAEERSPGIRFWWRDDDAVDVSPALDQLLELSRRFKAPLALAVIPERATPQLASRLNGRPDIAVLQHGWRHQNHSPPGEKKMELGDHRPVALVLDELRAGRVRLAELFPDTFLPVLVPPWNRIGDAVRGRTREVGLAGLSVFGPSRAGNGREANAHVDLMEWRPIRRPKPRAEIYRELCREMENRRAGNTEPIGILSHHLVHGDASWAISHELLEVIGTHRMHMWSHAARLFGTSPEQEIAQA